MNEHSKGRTDIPKDGRSSTKEKSKCLQNIMTILVDQEYPLYNEVEVCNNKNIYKTYPFFA